MLDRLGLVADFYCLIFHPWSTLETIAGRACLLEQAIPHHATIFSFGEVAAYPGTPLARRLQGEGRGEGVLWPLAYEIAEPRAELLRRLNGLIFGASTAHDRIRAGSHRLGSRCCWNGGSIRRPKLNSPTGSRRWRPK